MARRARSKERKKGTPDSRTSVMISSGILVSWPMRVKMVACLPAHSRITSITGGILPRAIWPEVRMMATSRVPHLGLAISAPMERP